MFKEIQKSSLYRPEIDGLRAFAVIAVIINHFNKDLLPSGYLGVDLFFVISGYVLTSSNSKNKAKSFKEFLINFYEKRINRLIPALVFFVCITSFLICLFDANPINSLRTGAASLIGISNLYLFQNNSDYFAPSIDLNPFAHTWSLGVEEQFYFFFPLLIWFSSFSRNNKKGSIRLLFINSIITIASLIGFIYFYPRNQAFAYFMMPTRLWEISIGSIVFILFQKNSNYNFVQIKLPSLLCILGLTFLFFLPIKYAILSTILSVILCSILLINLKEGTFAFNLFTQKNIVYIGLISYSLYLWHWPILCLSKWTFGASRWSTPLEVLLIIIISKFSYKYIENPFRKKRIFQNIKNKFLKLISLISVFLLSFIIFSLKKSTTQLLYSGDLENSIPLLNNVNTFVDDNSGRLASNCLFNPDNMLEEKTAYKKTRDAFRENCIWGNESNPLLAFIGDSHTLTLFPLFSSEFDDKSNGFLFHSISRCPFPIQGETKTFDVRCSNLQNSAWDIIEKEFRRREKGSILILTSYLNGYFSEEGDFPDEIFMEFSNKQDKLNHYLFLTSQYAEKLEKIGANIVIFAPYPQHKFFNSNICYQEWFRPQVNERCISTNKGHLIRQRKKVIIGLQEIEKQHPNLFIYDPFEKLCDKKNCHAVKDGINIFYDITHVNPNGINLFGDDFKKFILSLN